MRNKILLFVSAVMACGALVGCTGLASVAQQLKGDPAFVTAEVKTIYGSGFMVRDGRPNSGNVVSAAGDVTSTPNTNQAAAQVRLTQNDLAQLASAVAAYQAKGQAQAQPQAKEQGLSAQTISPAARRRAQRAAAAETNAPPAAVTNAPAAKQ